MQRSEDVTATRAVGRMAWMMRGGVEAEEEVESLEEAELALPVLELELLLKRR